MYDELIAVHHLWQVGGTWEQAMSYNTNKLSIYDHKGNCETRFEKPMQPMEKQSCTRPARGTGFGCSGRGIHCSIKEVHLLVDNLRPRWAAC
jgi:hypothetical protein